MSKCRYGCGYQSSPEDVEDHERYMLAIDAPDHQESDLIDAGPIRSFKDLKGDEDDRD